MHIKNSIESNYNQSRTFVFIKEFLKHFFKKATEHKRDVRLNKNYTAIAQLHQQNKYKN